MYPLIDKLYRNYQIYRNSSGAKEPAVCKIFTPESVWTIYKPICLKVIYFLGLDEENVQNFRISGSISENVRNIRHQLRNLAEICTKYRLVASLLRWRGLKIQLRKYVQNSRFMWNVQNYAPKILRYIMTSDVKNNMDIRIGVR